MNRRDAPLEPELEAFLSPGKIERHAPPEVRARALARGRAIIAAGGRIPPISTLELLAPPSAKPAPPRGLVRLVLPTSIAAAIAGLGAVAALRSPPAHTPTPAPSAQPAAAITEPLRGGYRDRASLIDPAGGRHSATRCAPQTRAQRASRGGTRPNRASVAGARSGGVHASRLWACHQPSQ